MEYRAVAEALSVLPDEVNATVFSDSRSLVLNLANKLADWRTSAFANVDPQIVPEVRRIDAAINEKRLRVRWQWLKAHNGNAANERADALARQGAREAKDDLLRRRT